MKQTWWKLNKMMILYLLLLFFILGLESTIGLPLFSIYLAYKFIVSRNNLFVLSAIFVISLFLALFYSLSWPILALVFLLFHFFNQKFAKNLLLGFLSFILFNLFIFIFAKLQLNYFYLLHLPIFLLYFYRVNFKKYAS